MTSIIPASGRDNTVSGVSGSSGNQRDITAKTASEAPKSKRVGQLIERFNKIAEEEQSAAQIMKKKPVKGAGKLAQQPVRKATERFQPLQSVQSAAQRKPIVHEIIGPSRTVMQHATPIVKASSPLVHSQAVTVSPVVQQSVQTSVVQANASRVAPLKEQTYSLCARHKISRELVDQFFQVCQQKNGVTLPSDPLQCLGYAIAYEESISGARGISVFDTKQGINSLKPMSKLIAEAQEQIVEDEAEIQGLNEELLKAQNLVSQSTRNTQIPRVLAAIESEKGLEEPLSESEFVQVTAQYEKDRKRDEDLDVEEHRLHKGVETGSITESEAEELLSNLQAEEVEEEANSIRKAIKKERVEDYAEKEKRIRMQATMLPEMREELAEEIEGYRDEINSLQRRNAAYKKLLGLVS